MRIPVQHESTSNSARQGTPLCRARSHTHQSMLEFKPLLPYAKYCCCFTSVVISHLGFVFIKEIVYHLSFEIYIPSHGGRFIFSSKTCYGAVALRYRYKLDFFFWCWRCEDFYNAAYNIYQKGNGETMLGAYACTFKSATRYAT